MFILLKIAWRNIWRNPRRSWVLVWAVTFGLWMGVFLTAFYNGLIEQRIALAINTESSHIQMHYPLCKPDYEIQHVLPDYPAILHSLNEIPQIQAVTSRMVIAGMAASANGSTGVVIQGVSPESEHRVTKLCQKLTSGGCLKEGNHHSVMVSERLAKKLKLKTGRKLVVSFTDVNGDIQSAALKISGLYKTNNGPYDDTNIFVHASMLDTLRNIGAQRNEIAILLQSSENLDQTSVLLKKKFPGLKTETWKEISPELGLTVSVGDQMVFIFMGIILLALVFGIINTMMMAMLERTREIGILMAIGMNKIRLFIMIVLETTILVALGAPPGILLGLSTVAFFARKGIDLSAYAGLYSNFGYASIVYPHISGEKVVQVLLMLVVASLISSVFPAWRSLRTQPAVAIKK